MLGPELIPYVRIPSIGQRISKFMCVSDQRQTSYLASQSLSSESSALQKCMTRVLGCDSKKRASPGNPGKGLRDENISHVACSW
jgi:hypothetical protein